MPFLQRCQVLHPHRQTPQPLRKGTVVLQGQNGRGYQNGHLLGIGHRLEGSPDGHLRLAEPHVAAHESVHRLCLLHVVLHEFDGLLLVGSLLVRERRLQLMLQITVGRKGKTAALLALGIQLLWFDVELE